MMTLDDTAVATVAAHCRDQETEDLVAQLF